MFVGLFIVAGMFIDLGANIVLLIPVLFPVTQQLGIDPVFFGVVTVVALAIGLVTPPVGASLFITCDISKTPLMDAFKASLPYLGGVLLTLVADDPFSRDRDVLSRPAGRMTPPKRLPEEHACRHHMKALVFHGDNDLRLRGSARPDTSDPTKRSSASGAVGICGSDVHGFSGQDRPPDPADDHGARVRRNR